MKRIISIVLSLILVLTNISLTYATHYCGGKAVDGTFMLGNQDLSCGMIAPESTCENDDDDCNSSNHEEMTTDCCDNQYVSLSVDDDFTTSDLSLGIQDFSFLATFVVVVYNFSFQNEKTSGDFRVESPPLIAQDFQVLYQVFRI